jgi:hypothetical protein
MEEAATSENQEGANTLSVQDRELADAKTKGLLVDLGDSISPTSVVAHARSTEMKEMDEWDNAKGGDEFFCSDDDSDDDLL